MLSIGLKYINRMRRFNEFYILNEISNAVD